MEQKKRFYHGDPKYILMANRKAADESESKKRKTEVIIIIPKIISSDLLSLHFDVGRGTSENGKAYGERRSSC